MDTAMTELYQANIFVNFKHSMLCKDAEKMMREKGSLPWEKVRSMLSKVHICIIVSHKEPAMSDLLTRLIHDDLIPDEFWAEHGPLIGRHFRLIDDETGFNSSYRNVIQTAQRNREAYPNNPDGMAMIGVLMAQRQEYIAQLEGRSFFSQPSQEQNAQNTANSYNSHVQY